MKNLSTQLLAVATAGLVFSGTAFAQIAAPGTLVFSLDIGSDKEISDPLGGIGEEADPGDVYASDTTLGSLLGTPPFRDDTSIFVIDPDPVQFAPATAVTVGGGGGGIVYREAFDQDAVDFIGYSLRQFIPPNAPLDLPLRRNQLPPLVQRCIHDAKFLSVSFDDDHPLGWRAPAAPRVPVEGPSPAGWTYGTTGMQDEVVNLEAGLGAFPPVALISSSSYVDEAGVHVDLAANPDGAENEDDDVDALDVLHEGSDVCRVHMFSADHEGRGALSPDVIYQSNGAMAAPTPIIRRVHLGTPPRIDIDAFEFAWVSSPNQPPSLALLYSVDDDDPNTAAVDESGGLDPAAIYGSFLTGASFIYLDSSEFTNPDDIDGLTASPDPLGDQSGGDGFGLSGAEGLR